MKTQQFISIQNYNGGINNMNIVQVRDKRLNLIGSFTSLKTLEHAKKRATTFQNKLANK
jgi:hypothetical protein